MGAEISARSKTSTGAANDAASAQEGRVFLTLTVEGQLCGVPVLSVRDVLGPQLIRRIPLAPPEVAGSLNLRGRIVTAIDLRRRLGLTPRGAEETAMSVVVEHGTELYSLLADSVGDVIPLWEKDAEPNPPTLDTSWKDVSCGVHRLEGRLLVVLDVERLLAIS